ncbi:hypothetical protein ACEN2P_18680 [Pedobacter psychrotolerans]|uniref:hypothetical protein n=1 Tax=Pedobacter psychrotolerans TaxID=1843235 RepID=UPI003F98C84A
MKKNKNLGLLILLSFSMISLFSCKKDANREDVAKKTSSNAVTVENGYLKFRDQKTFDSLINILLKANGTHPLVIKNSEGFKSYKEFYLEVEKEFSNLNDDLSFKKFQTKYSGLVEIKADSSISYKFGTPLSALFTNINGEVKIGDMMIVYNKKGKIISYVGQKKSELELENIKKTDSSKNIYVQNLSIKNRILAGTPVNGSTSTSVISSQLYYNEDGKRRLFVDLWADSTPRTDSETNNNITPIIRYYFTSRQELKRTFGGWRTNETDYYFSNLNYNYSIANPPMLTENINFNLPYYSVGSATGPIIVDLGSKVGYLMSTLKGAGRFYSGGVPNAPLFSIN